MKKQITIEISPEELRVLIKEEVFPIFEKLGSINLEVNDQILGVSELSSILGLEESTIYSLTSKRKIPHYKPGKKLLFKKSEIEDWILAHRCSMVNPPKSNSKNLGSCA